MTWKLWDVSEYENVSLAGQQVVIARATIGLVQDKRWVQYANDAKQHGVKLIGYHFLNSGTLGVSPTQQAQFAHSVLGNTPCMLDVETNRGASASVAETVEWLTEYRRQGGVCNLVYFPHWYWQQLGQPDLTVLDCHLVSSNYTTYTDNGPGWDPYGGLTPIQWQYTDTPVDTNAVKISIDEYWTLVTGEPPMTDADRKMLTAVYYWLSTLVQFWNPTDKATWVKAGGDPAVYDNAVASGTGQNVLVAKLAELIAKPDVTLTDAQVATLANAIGPVVHAELQKLTLTENP